ncbi:hypothetical protein VTL71DRAFT_3321 [Oculimacula yallundae]|uniref:Uncharacterized protein n=1 Tax=Oculimacula yallundae TaxID=86028 RepID=A0ABR4C6T6_9HELO
MCDHSTVEPTLRYPDECRGIPTGYLSLLEHRLSETESLLYHALSELRALALRDEPGSGLVALENPGRYRTYREVGGGKKTKMEEWRMYPLGTLEEVERWRRFVGGELGGVETHDEIPDESSRVQSAEYQNLPNEQPTHTNSDRDLLVSSNVEAGSEFSVAAGLIGVSRVHDRTQNQKQQSANPNSASSTNQLSNFLDSTTLPRSHSTPGNVQGLPGTAYAAGSTPTRDMQTFGIAPEPDLRTQSRPDNQSHNTDGSGTPFPSHDPDTDNGSDLDITHQNVGRKSLLGTEKVG